MGVVYHINFVRQVVLLRKILMKMRIETNNAANNNTANSITAMAADM